MAVTPETEIVAGIGNDYKYGFHDEENYVFKSERGLSTEVVAAISERKNEPDWMRKFRLKSLEYFMARPLPEWGGDLSQIDFDNIYYYIKPTEEQANTWEDLPADIKNTWDRLGIPEAERKFLAGVGAQYESEVVYHKLQEKLESQGVIFKDMGSGLRDHEELVKQYFGTIIPQNDNKFAALNSAVWSGGSFIYVPPGVSIEMPLQAYFRINAENMGQFERTMIIVDEDSWVHYVEGCSAPVYSSDSLHSAVVEIIVKPRGRCRYTTIQNWSNNVYNLVTKRAVAYEGATMEWVDGNLGSKVTMKYPAVWLMGERAHGEVLSIAFGGKGQHQDAGGKVVHVAPRTSSVINSKSISKDGGRAGYRGLLQVAKGAVGSKSKVVCDALILDEESRSHPYPYIHVDESDVDLGHEASVSKIGAQKPRQVLDAQREFYETSYTNVHRGVYLLAERATERFEGAREKVRALINAASTREIVFTRSATEALNLVAYAWGLDNLGPGDLVVVTELEHHSNFVPWQFIARRTGAEFRSIPIDDAGELRLDALDAIASAGNVKVVAN